MPAYNKLTAEAAEELRRLLGPGRFFSGDAVKEQYSHDEMPIYGKYPPEAVCLVESTEVVSAIMHRR